jgi:hemolysin activation/secretion protein
MRRWTKGMQYHAMRIRHVGGCLIVAGLSVGIPQRALAQTASQLTEPNYAPPVVRQVRGGFTLPATAGLAAPQGAETLVVTPAGLSVVGGLAPLEAETAAINARLSGKQVSGADLFAAARDLEAAYARAGYLLVRVSLPPQTIIDGQPLRLVVTDGYVEAVDATALPSLVRGRLAAVLSPLVGQKGLTRHDLERRLLLASDVPGVMLRSTLKPGGKPGATILVVDGRYDPVTASVSVDNGLSGELGQYPLGLGAEFNGLIGLGEVGYVRLLGYPGVDGGLLSDDPRNRQIVAGLTLPLGTDGLWFGLEGVDSRTHPQTGVGYTILDHFQRFSTRIGYSWVRSRAFNTSSVLSFDLTEERQEIEVDDLQTGWSEDRLRILRLKQAADAYLPDGAVVSGDATLSFGLDGLGARHASTSLPLSRVGASPDFVKLELTGRYEQGFLDDRLQLTASAKGQTSFGDPLVSSEQFGLGGFDWLSAFGNGSLQGDAGAAFRAELAFPQAMEPLFNGQAFGGAVAPYLFGAAGIVKLEQATAVERDVTRAAAFGLGLRFGVAQRESPGSASLTVEYGHGVASGLESDNRFNLRFATSF